MELSDRDYNRMKENCINVNGITITNNILSGAYITHYSEVTYGSKANKTRKKIDSKWCIQINLHKTNS